MFNDLTLKFKLNKNQSFKYQLMLILMEEHRRARHGKKHNGEYDGGNVLLFDLQSWGKMKEKFKEFISKGYNVKQNNFNDQYILGLFEKENSLCLLLAIYNTSTSQLPGADTDNKELAFTEEDTKTIKYFKFEMLEEGYSYQYNGYRRSSEKLQMTANWLLGVTIVYYLVSWILDIPKIKLVTVTTSFGNLWSYLKFDFSIVPTIAIVVALTLFMYEKFIKKLF